MPRPRFDNLPDEVRQRLLDVAREKFAAHGFAGTSLNSILSAAGISKGACYYYFDDKEDLFATVVERKLADVFASQPPPSADALTARTFWPALAETIRHWLALFDSSDGLMRAMLQLGETERAHPRFQQLTSRGLVLWENLIRTGQRLRCVRTDLPLALLVALVAANDRALDLAFAAEHPRPSAKDYDAYVARVLDTLRRLLAPSPVKSAAKRSKR